MEQEKKLSLMQLVWIATGHVVGAGVVTIVGSALGVTGYSAWFAFSAAVLMGLVRVCPRIFFYSAVVAPGGPYGMITRCCGKRFGGISTIASLINCICRGTAVLSIGNYLVAMFPGTNKAVMACGVWALLTVANLFGVNIMAKIQSIATPCLLVCLVTFSVVCCFNVQPGYMNFSSPEMFTNGLTGWLSAVVLLNYSTDGQSMIASFAPRAVNPKKNIPLAILIATGIIFVLYTLVGFASGAVLPLEQTAGGTMTDTARYLLPPFFYYIFMFGGPIFALLTTMNAGIMNSALPALAGVKEGWLPSLLVKQNRYGAYWVMILFIFVVGCLPVCVGMSVAQITNSSLIVAGLQSALLIASGFLFPTRFKKEWEESWLHIGKVPYYGLMLLSGVACAFLIYRSLLDLTIPLIVINVVIVAAAILYSIYRMRTVNIQETDYV